jgi:hypothetical protein
VGTIATIAAITARNEEKVITVSLHSPKYLALRSDFAHKDSIKALADYPDVKWDGDSKVWLVHVELMDKLIANLGDVINPLDVDFVMAMPLRAPAEQRRVTRQQVMAEKAENKAAIRRAGKTLVEYGRATR